MSINRRRNENENRRNNQLLEIKREMIIKENEMKENEIDNQWKKCIENYNDTKMASNERNEIIIEMKEWKWSGKWK